MEIENQVHWDQSRYSYSEVNGNRISRNRNKDLNIPREALKVNRNILGDNLRMELVTLDLGLSTSNQLYWVTEGCRDGQKIGVFSTRSSEDFYIHWNSNWEFASVSWTAKWRWWNRVVGRSNESRYVKCLE